MNSIYEFNIWMGTSLFPTSTKWFFQQVMFSKKCYADEQRAYLLSLGELLYFHITKRQELRLFTWQQWSRVENVFLYLQLQIKQKNRSSEMLHSELSGDRRAQRWCSNTWPAVAILRLCPSRTLMKCLPRCTLMSPPSKIDLRDTLSRTSEGLLGSRSL